MKSEVEATHMEAKKANSAAPANGAQAPGKLRVKMQSISADREVVRPQETVWVEGSVAGLLSAQEAVVWRAQKATIEASERIVIKKEIIGVDPEEVPVRREGGAEGERRQGMILTAPVVAVGTKGEQASMSKNIEINTEKLLLYNVAILGEVVINLGMPLFQKKLRITHLPQKLAHQFKLLQAEVDEDIEDLKTRANRPGKEEARPHLHKLIMIMKRSPKNKGITMVFLRKLLKSLLMFNTAELLKRWEKRYEVIATLDAVNAELGETYKRLAELSLTMNIREIRSGGRIVIVYENHEEHVIEGPLSGKLFSIKCNLVDDDADSSQKHGVLAIKSQG